MPRYPRGSGATVTRYRGSIDRTGWALALGGACVGTGTLLSGWGGGEGALGALVAFWLAGTALGLVLIAGIGWPVWRLVARSGRRGPVAAGVTGAAVGGLAALAVVTQGFGLGLRASEAAAIWGSGLATAAVAAFLGGLIALAMWLVAYRPG